MTIRYLLLPWSSSAFATQQSLHLRKSWIVVRRRDVPSARHNNGIYAPNRILEAVTELCEPDTQEDVRASMLGTWVDKREEANALLEATGVAYDGGDSEDDED